MQYLLAVDMDREPERIVELAARWVQGTSHTIDAVYVPPYVPTVWDRSIPPETMAAVEDDLRTSRDRAERELAELLDGIPAPNRGSSTVSDPGAAAKQIIDHADDHDAIMVGTHEHSTLGVWLVGSVAERVVRHADRSVVVLNDR